MAISQGFSNMNGDVDETVSSTSSMSGATGDEARKKAEQQQQAKNAREFGKASTRIFEAGESFSNAGARIAEAEPIKEAQDAAVTTFSGAFAPFINALDNLTGNRLTDAPKNLFESLKNKFEAWKNPAETENPVEAEKEAQSELKKKVEEQTQVQREHFARVESQNGSLSSDLEDSMERAFNRSLRGPSLVWDSTFSSMDNIWKFLVESFKQRYFTDQARQQDQQRYQEELLERNDEIIDVLQRAEADEPGGGGGLLAALGVGIAATAAFLKKKVVGGIFKPLGTFLYKGIIKGVRSLTGNSFLKNIGKTVKKVFKSVLGRIFVAVFSIRALFKAFDEVTDMSDEELEKYGGFFPALIQKFAEELIGPETLAKLQEWTGKIVVFIGDVISALGESISEWFSELSKDPSKALGDVAKGLSSVLTKLGELFNEYVIEPLAPFVGEFFEPFKNVLSKAFENIAPWITEKYDSMMDSIKGFMSSSFDWIDEKLQPLRDLKDAVMGFIDSVLDNPLVKMFRSDENKKIVDRLEDQGIVVDRLINVGGRNDVVDFSKLEEAGRRGQISSEDLEAIKDRLSLSEADSERIDRVLLAIAKNQAASEARMRASADKVPRINTSNQSEAYTQAAAAGVRQAAESAQPQQAGSTTTQVVQQSIDSRRNAPVDPYLASVNQGD